MSRLPLIYRKNYNINFNYLQKINPDLHENLNRNTEDPPFEIAQDGSPTMKTHGIYLESKYNPKRHALRLVNNKANSDAAVIFLGSGLGYHINAFLQNVVLHQGVLHQGVYRYVLIEKDPDIFKAALYIIKPQFFPRILPVIGEEPDKAFKKIGSLLLRKLSIVKHPQGIGLSRKYYHSIELWIRKRIEEQIASLITENGMQRLWLKNILKNVRRRDGEYSGTIKCTGLFKGPVVLIASGPFLEDIIEDIKQMSKNLPLFALLPSLPYLIKHGIKPDLIITTDAGFGNQYRFVQGVKIPLFTTYSAAPAVLKNWLGTIFLFSHGLPLEKNLETVRRWSIGIPMQGTSSAVMILIARIMGFTKIYLGGFDFAYRGMKDHHEGAGFDSYYAASASRFKNCHTAVFKGFRKDSLISVKTRSGEMIYSSYKLLLYRDWLDDEVAAEDVYRLNDGVSMKNIKTATIGALNTFSSKNKSAFCKKIQEAEECRIPADVIQDDFMRIKSRLDKTGDLSGANSIDGLYRMFYGKIPEGKERAEMREDIIFAVDSFHKSYRYRQS